MAESERKTRNYELIPDEELLTRLHQIRAISVGEEVELTLNKLYPNYPEKSLFYINIRNLRSYIPERSKVVELFIKHIQTRGLRPDLLVDIPNSITPIVTLISERLQIPMITVPKEAKDTGLTSQKEIHGNWQEGMHSLIIDDVEGAGLSKDYPIEVLRKNNLLVNQILVFVDRQEGGVERLASKRGVKTTSVYNASQILTLYRDNGLITPELCNETLARIEGLRQFVNNLD